MKFGYRYIIMFILNFQLFPDFLLGLLIRTIVLYYILTKYSLRA